MSEDQAEQFDGIPKWIRELGRAKDSSVTECATDREATVPDRFRKNLSEAEKRLLRSAVGGQTAVCGPNENDQDPANDPAAAGSWDREREIRAELIRWLASDPAALMKIDSRGIRVYASKITGKLDLSFVTIHIPIRFYHCCLTDDADLRGAEIPEIGFNGSTTRSLNLDGARVAGNVYLRDNFSAEGEVLLRGAQIGSSLLGDGISLINPGDIALNADRARVAGSVHLRGQLVADGEIRLVGAQIGGNFDCSDATFRGAHGRAISADRLKVEGDVFLRGGFAATGAIRLPGAEIKGDLDCSGGTLTYPGGDALQAENAHIGGNVLLRNGFRVEGSVDLNGTQIGGGIDCRSGTFSNLNLSGSVVKGVLCWRNVQCPGTARLDLGNASVGTLLDEEESWPHRGNLGLDGFSYVRLSEGSVDVTKRIRWLARVDPFATHPYRQLAQVLRESGDDRGARRILFELEHHRREAQDLRWYRRVWSWILRWTIGYGQMSWWALWWLLGLTALGCLLCGLGYLGGAIAPNEKEAYETFLQQGYPPDHYSQFNPLVYSLEHSFPLINLRVKDHWEPKLCGSTVRAVVNWGVFRWMQAHHLRLSSPRSLRWWMWIQTLAGWVLATLFVAGLTGIVKSG